LINYRFSEIKIIRNISSEPAGLYNGIYKETNITNKYFDDLCLKCLIKD
jgi:hypothetical protein